MSDQSTEDLQRQMAEVKRAQMGSDRKAGELQDKLKTANKELERLRSFAEKETEIKDRLKAVEAGYAKRIKDLELTHYAEVKSLKTGVDYELVAPVRFESTDQIDAYVGKLAAYVEQNRLAGVESMIRGTAPQAGATVKPSALANVVSRAMGSDQSGDF